MTFSSNSHACTTPSNIMSITFPYNFGKYDTEDEDEDEDDCVCVCILLCA